MPLTLRGILPLLPLDTLTLFDAMLLIYALATYDAAMLILPITPPSPPISPLSFTPRRFSRHYALIIATATPMIDCRHCRARHTTTAKYGTQAPYARMPLRHADTLYVDIFAAFTPLFIMLRAVCHVSMLLLRCCRRLSLFFIMRLFIL